MVSTINRVLPWILTGRNQLYIDHQRKVLLKLLLEAIDMIYANARHDYSCTFYSSFCFLGDIG